MGKNLGEMAEKGSVKIEKHERLDSILKKTVRTWVLRGIHFLNNGKRLLVKYKQREGHCNVHLAKRRTLQYTSNRYKF
jgi:hypothetical protein